MFSEWLEFDFSGAKIAIEAAAVFRTVCVNACTYIRGRVETLLDNATLHTDLNRGRASGGLAQSHTNRVSDRVVNSWTEKRRCGEETTRRTYDELNDDEEEGGRKTKAKTSSRCGGDRVRGKSRDVLRGFMVTLLGKFAIFPRTGPRPLVRSRS